MGYFGSGAGAAVSAGTVCVSAGTSGAASGVAGASGVAAGGAADAVSTGTGCCGITNGPLLPQADKQRVAASTRGNVYFMWLILASIPHRQLIQHECILLGNFAVALEPPRLAAMPRFHVGPEHHRMAAGIELAQARHVLCRLPVLHL